MPTIEQIRHHEQDPFQLERQKSAESTITSAPAAPEKIVAPHLVAEVPKQSQASLEQQRELNKHFANKKEDDDEASSDTRVVAQSDPRQSARDLVARHREPGDEFGEGMDGDFVPDSQRGAGIDTPPPPSWMADAVFDGWNEKRRRAEAAGEIHTDTHKAPAKAAAGSKKENT